MVVGLNELNSIFNIELSIRDRRLIAENIFDNMCAFKSVDILKTLIDSPKQWHNLLVL
jgi:hypothetical protein